MDPNQRQLLELERLRAKKINWNNQAAANMFRLHIFNPSAGQSMADAFSSQNSYALINETIDKMYDAKLMAASANQVGATALETAPFSNTTAIGTSSASAYPTAPFSTTGTSFLSPHPPFVMNNSPGEAFSLKTCDVCMRKIDSTTYRCSVCPFDGYTLCERCFKARQKSKYHNLTDIMYKQSATDPRKFFLTETLRSYSNVKYDEELTCMSCHQKIYRLCINVDEHNHNHNHICVNCTGFVFMYTLSHPNAIFYIDCEK